MRNKKAIKLLLAFAIIIWLPVAFEMGDLGDTYSKYILAGVPRRTILVYHQFPLWNPWSSGGVPHLAYPISSFLSPGFAFSLAFGPVIGPKLHMLLALCIGLCGAFLFGRCIAPGRFAPFLCPFIYMFSSWYPLYMSKWHTEFIPFVYLPWLILFYHKAMENTRWCAAGGLTLALMIFGGGIYAVPYALLFLSLYALLISATRKRFSPLIVFLFMVLLGLALSAVKLIPVLDLVSRNPRTTFWKEPVVPWCALPRIFLGRDQLSEANVPGGVLGWWEYGAYVGVLSMILALAAPFLARRKAVPLTILALFFFGLMFGDYSDLSLWHWVHKLPLFSSLHDPIRFRIILVFCLSALAAMAVSRIEKIALSTNTMWNLIMSLAIGIATVGIAADLMFVSGPLYSRVSSGPALQPSRYGEFQQRRLPKDERLGPLSFVCFLQNEGLVNTHDGLGLPLADVRAYGEPNYKGEVWLRRGEGSVETLSWSPNRLSYKLALTEPDTLLINQRYDPGWRAFDGRPVHSRNGILAVEVSPADSKVSLYYVPRLFYLGCVLSLVGLLLGLFVWRKG